MPPQGFNVQGNRFRVVGVFGVGLESFRFRVEGVGIIAGKGYGYKRVFLCIQGFGFRGFGL